MKIPNINESSSEGVKQLKRSLLKVTKSNFDILNELIGVNQKSVHFYIDLTHSNNNVATSRSFTKNYWIQKCLILVFHLCKRHLHKARIKSLEIIGSLKIIVNLSKTKEE